MSFDALLGMACISWAQAHAMGLDVVSLKQQERALQQELFWSQNDLQKRRLQLELNGLIPKIAALQQKWTAHKQTAATQVERAAAYKWGVQVGNAYRVETPERCAMLKVTHLVPVKNGIVMTGNGALGAHLFVLGLEPLKVTKAPISPLSLVHSKV